LIEEAVLARTLGSALRHGGDFAEVFAEDRRTADGHAVDRESRADAVVLDEQTVGVGDEHAAPGIGVARAHLAHRAVDRPCGVVGALEHRRLAGLLDRLRQHRDLVRAAGLPTLQGHLPHATLGAAGGGRRGLGRSQEAGLGEVGRVGETRGVSPDDADPGAAFTARDELLDLAVVEAGAGGAAVFGEHLGEVATMPKRSLERALKNRLFDQHRLLRGCLS